jgi:tyrosyl-tRNA synthetase
MGGADQWGNITAGLELIRRTQPPAADRSDLAHGLSYPLLLDPTGKKFGKTAAGTSVWLDPARTSPYAFYQFWLDRDDTETDRLVRMFTLLPEPEITALLAEGAGRPEARLGQRRLAEDLTRMVHGQEVLEQVVAVSEAVFGRTLPQLGSEMLAFAYEQLPNATVPAEALAGGPVGVSVAAGLFASNGEARRAISQGGLSINEARVASVDEAVPALLPGGYLVLRSGKKAYLIARVAVS